MGRKLLPSRLDGWGNTIATIPLMLCLMHAARMEVEKGHDIAWDD